MMSFETCDSNLCKELGLRGATKVEQISFPTERGRFRKNAASKVFCFNPKCTDGVPMYSWQKGLVADL